MVTRDQLGWLGLDSGGVSAAALVSYRTIEPLHAELRLAGSYFLSDSRRDGALAELGLGVRLALPIASWLRLEPAAHLSAGWTGPLVRPAFDASVGAAVQVSRAIAIGPELAYGHVFWTDGPSYSTDAGFAVVRLVFAWRHARSDPPRERVRTIERTRDVHTVEREVIHERISVPPADSAELDRLLDEALPVTHREEVVLIPPILFQFDSTRILPEGEVALHAARDLIADMPDDIVIEGHADGTGSDAYNAELSLARAMWVRDWLVRHGIDGNRLSVDAHGEHRPLAPETDDWTRQLSRRVTFRAARVVEEPPR